MVCEHDLFCQKVLNAAFLVGQIARGSWDNCPAKIVILRKCNSVHYRQKTVQSDTVVGANGFE